MNILGHGKFERKSPQKYNAAQILTGKKMKAKRETNTYLEQVFDHVLIGIDKGHQIFRRRNKFHTVRRRTVGK